MSSTGINGVRNVRARRHGHERRHLLFISCRRDDTRQAAGHLADDLGDRLGAERIFRDIEKIELGVDFQQALNQALERCEIMLLPIGPNRATILDVETGARRLHQPTDWVRVAIVTALRHGIRVVPVLIDGARPPPEAELPAAQVSSPWKAAVIGAVVTLVLGIWLLDALVTWAETPRSRGPAGPDRPRTWLQPAGTTGLPSDLSTSRIS